MTRLGNTSVVMKRTSVYDYYLCKWRRKTFFCRKQIDVYLSNFDIESGTMTRDFIRHLYT